MSLFDNDGSNNQSVIEQLVGEGKKFKDAEALARGKMEADTYIETLKKELEASKAELAKQNHAAELLEELRRNKDKELTPSDDDKGAPQNRDDTKSDKGDVDFKALVKEVLSEQDTEQRVAKNVALVNETLTKMWGDKAQEQLKAKAAELGVSMDFLKSTAGTSADAFFRLIGEKAKVDSLKFESSSVRTESLPSSGEKTWEYYQKLRKENPQLYRSNKIQQEIIENWESIKPRK